MGDHEKTFKAKLKSLTGRAEAIAALSKWVLSHEAHYKSSVSIWNEQFYTASNDQLIQYLWLCNDILQKSNHDGGKFAPEFKKYIGAALSHMSKNCEQKDINRTERVLNIWQERGVYPSTFIDTLRSRLKTKEPAPAAAPEPAVAASPQQPKSDHPLVDALLQLESEAVQDAVLAQKVSGPITRIVATLEKMESGGVVDKIPPHGIIMNAHDTLEVHSERLRKQIERRMHLMELLQLSLVQEQKTLDKAKLELEKTHTQLQKLDHALNSPPEQPQKKQKPDSPPPELPRGWQPIPVHGQPVNIDL